MKASKSEKTRAEILREWGIWSVQMAAILLGIYIFLGVLFGLARVSGPSMTPTLMDGDYCFFQRVNLNLEHGDIVIIKSKALDEMIIKRVMGLPGDVIEIDRETQTVYRNGEKLEEAYTNSLTYPGHLKGPVTVEDGHIFVMGDNRSNSTDSRFHNLGQVPEEEVLGKVLVKMFNLKALFARESK